MGLNTNSGGRETRCILRAYIGLISGDSRHEDVKIVEKLSTRESDKQSDISGEEAD